jgi:NAD+ synthase (glutamine-hydrolysing)
MKDGFVRVGAATPAIKVADCLYNAERTVELAQEAARQGASLVVFPELGLTGYTCGDLFLSETLLSGAEAALEKVLEGTAALDVVLAVGLPVRLGGSLYNCAAVMSRGKLLGVVPKTNLPNYAEFYEARHFSPGGEIDAALLLAGQETRLCARQVFPCQSMPQFILGVEVCEDLWVTAPPSQELAAAGATVIANLSASDETVGKAAFRRQLVQGQSSRLMCAYVYADAGQGESTQDLIFSGHNLIAENGTMLEESQPFTTGVILSDVDVEKMVAERRRQNTYPKPGVARMVPFSLEMRELTLRREVSPTPFVPCAEQELAARCEDIFLIQAEGLCTRLRHTGIRKVVLALSGGLDSTLALIVTARAFDRLGLDRKGIVAVTMPCFGTTARTKSNAMLLAEAYGATLRHVDIGKAVAQHFEDIGQDMENHDVTFENSQARERTQVAMDIANQVGGLVVGTGDLSELALGWATYNGDHMSMYAVNCSIPKTLVRHLVAYEAARSEGARRDVLLDVLDTPVSPELLPPKDGKIAQRTEEIVGPYELHDFFLYYLVRFGFSPRKIYRLCKLAMAGRYSDEEIKKWLLIFLRRFFAQQFKRSCLPDGPKVGTVGLSPRGDWRMPSDASAALWLREAETL